MRRLFFLLVLCLSGAQPARADFLKTVTAFSWNAADVATTTYDVTVGFEAKCGIVFTSGISGTVDAAARGDSYLGFGAFVSNASRAAIGYRNDDAAAAEAIGIRHDVAQVLTFSNTAVGGNDSGRLDVTTIDADSVIFTVDTQVAANVRAVLIAWGGSDISACGVGSFQEPLTATTVAEAHGLGATPTGVIFYSGCFSTAPPEDNGADAAGHGFFVSAYDGTNGWVVMNLADDANVSSTSRAYAKADEIAACGTPNAATIDMIATTASSSLDATNITVNFSQVNTSIQRYIFYIAWVGGQFQALDDVTAIDTNAFTGPTAGYTPTIAFIASANRVEDTTDTPTNSAVFSMGAATSTSDQVAQGMHNVTALADTDVAVVQEVGAVYVNFDPATMDTTPANRGEMRITGFNDPLDLVMDDADPTANFFGAAIWGAAVAASGGRPGLIGGGLLQ